MNKKLPSNTLHRSCKQLQYHTVFLHMAADNIHTTFFILFIFFLFFFFEVHCCYPYKVPKVTQRADVSNVYLFSKTAEERSLFVITNLSGSVFKGYFPNFSLFFFFCMFDTLGATLFSKISFFVCSTAGVNQLFLHSQNTFLFPFNL